MLELSYLEEFTSEEIELYKNIFCQFDKENNFTIMPDDLSKAMKRLGIDLGQEELKSIIDNYSNEDTPITFDEFILCVKKGAQNENLKQICFDSFSQFDQNKSGKIHKSCLKEILSINGDLQPSEIEIILENFQFDQNEFLNYQDFIEKLQFTI